MRKNIIMAIIGFITALLIFGCKTNKEVINTSYVHDTLTVYKCDTVQILKIKTVHDTTKQTENHYVTLNNDGDTIKEVHIYHYAEHTIVVDSTERYQSKVDSLQRLVNKLEKEKVVKKQYSIPWWWLIVILVIIFVGFYISHIIEKKYNNN